MARATSREEAHTALRQEVAEELETGPVGRPANKDVDSYINDNSWRPRALAEVQAASQVVVASFVMDDPQLTTALCRRLNGRAPFSCSILVDAEYFDKLSAPHQRPRLVELKRAGARVFLCQGNDGRPEFGPNGRPGCYHPKALLIDQRVCYTGSGNFTKASKVNEEWMFRMVGPPVQAMSDAIQQRLQNSTTRVM